MLLTLVNQLALRILIDEQILFALVNNLARKLVVLEV